MANQTPDQLTALASLADNDLIMIYAVADGVLKKMTALVLINRILDEIGTGTFLTIGGNLSDVDDTAQARSNLGLGSAAVQAVTAFLAPGNNLNDVSNAAAARANLGAAGTIAQAFTGGASVAGGLTVTGNQALSGTFVLNGSMKQSVAAVAAAAINVSAADFQTKSISANTTFTFTGATADNAQGFLLDLTLSAGAQPTFPASVLWEDGLDPVFANGRYLLGFITTDAATSWIGVVGANAVS